MSVLSVFSTILSKVLPGVLFLAVSAGFVLLDPSLGRQGQRPGRNTAELKKAPSSQ